MYDITANMEQVRKDSLRKKGKERGEDKKEFVDAYDPVSDLFLIHGSTPLKREK